MKGQYPYEIRASYPHMGPEDTKVWTRFVSTFPDRYDSVDYDVKVGTPPPFVESGELPIGGDTRNLYLRKIDVVGFRDGKIDIIEVKPVAGFSAIGQIRGYLMLWRQKFGGVVPARPVIITESINQDVRTMAEIDGIDVFIV